MRHWIETNEKVGGSAAIKHRLTGELTVFGTRGEIWEVGIDKYAVRFNRGFDMSDPKSEGLIKFPKSEFGIMLSKIDAPQNSSLQAVYANRFV